MLQAEERAHCCAKLNCPYGVMMTVIVPTCSPSQTCSFVPATPMEAKTPAKVIPVDRLCWAWTELGLRLESYRLATNVPNLDFLVFIQGSHISWIGLTRTLTEKTINNKQNVHSISVFNWSQHLNFTLVLTIRSFSWQFRHWDSAAQIPSLKKWNLNTTKKDICLKIFIDYDHCVILNDERLFFCPPVAIVFLFAWRKVRRNIGIHFLIYSFHLALFRCCLLISVFNFNNNFLLQGWRNCIH